MLLSLNWLKELVDIEDISTEEIVKRLNLSTAEIESVTNKGDDMEDVVVAKVNTCEKLLNTNHLNLLSVDDGINHDLQIVTGAPNVYAGMKTALVRVGGKVAGRKITKAKLAGIESFGMCCSETELGIGNDDEGIIDFKDDKLEVGASLKDIFPIEDTIIEIDNKSLTNRPDLWGHFGFARELSVIFDRPLKQFNVVDLSKLKGLEKISVKVETDGCYRYSALRIDNVNVKKSPYLIKIRLNYCGLRDINLLADLTNYLMLEIGQPMHAFDNKVVDGIVVRESKKEEKLLTLENELHDIPEDCILICDKNDNPVAIAGIKGGLNSGISDQTNGFLLESATFDPVKIRKASRKIGLTTDSSLRYEKSLDQNMTTLAIARLVYILKNIDEEIVITSELSDNINMPSKNIEIDMNIDTICERIGITIEKNRILSILKKLGFSLEEKSEKEYIVTVPSYRATKDISIQEDLVEEIARLVGYDNIPALPIQDKVTPVEVDSSHKLEYEVKILLAEKYGVSEVHSYVWNYADFNKSIGFDTKSYLSLTDATNSGQSGIRSQLVPSLLQFFDNNKNNFSEIKIAEIGRVCAGVKEDGSAIEEKRLAILLANTKKSEKELYFELKKMMEDISCNLIGSKIDFELDAEKNYLFGPASCKIVVDNNVIGEMGVLFPTIKQNLDKRFNIALLELDFNKFAQAEVVEKKISKISKYQSVSMDFNFMVPNKFAYKDLQNIISQFRCRETMSYNLKDIYKDENIKDKISMTFNFEICSKEHTLSNNEIETFRRRILDHMKKHGIELKS